ncbi:MAG: phosphate acetyltransferase, partial [Mameliella sp.]|nr:phosphate acetyltransferase [Mameliella sp.]
MTFLERAFDRARARRARVVFPELEEPRVAAACDRLRAEGLATPIGLIPTSDAMIATLVEARGMKESLARRMLDRPLYRAAAMVAAGEAEAMV